MSSAGKLTVDSHFDLICPWCFIGKRQLELARAKFAREFPGVPVATAWLPVQLLPELPEQGMPFTEFYERRLGSAQAVRERQQQVLLAASRVGLRLDFAAIARMPNSSQAHALLRRVALLQQPELYEALLERLFAAHFQYGEDIGDAGTLRALAIETGVPLDRLAASVAGPGPVPAAAGIMGVPYFVFNDGISLSGAHDAEVLFTAMKLAVHGSRVPAAMT